MTDTILRIAVQSKGRLADDTLRLLADAGIKFSAAKRSLLVPASNFPVELLMLRDDDIPDSVATGTADIGIVGLNEVLEKSRPVNIIDHLGFSRCHLSLAIPATTDYTGTDWFQGKKIATSYPVILSSFLKGQGIDADIHVITGSVEIAPRIGLADAIFDIVSSGSTLVSNNLVEVQRVIESEAVLIGKPQIADGKKTILDELRFRFSAVKAAEGKKYVLMNVPADRLDDILAELPGIKSPTVLPLADPQWRSVHTVVDSSRLWDLIGRLKSAGAEGILTLDIENIIL